MSILSEVLRVLDDALALDGRSAAFDADTPLRDALPEFNSLGVVNLMTGLEQHFGVSLPDDELDGVFDTVGSLARFIEELVQRGA